MEPDNNPKKSALLKLVLTVVLVVALFVALYFAYNVLAEANLDKSQSGQTLQPESSPAQVDQSTENQSSASTTAAADYSAPEIKVTDPRGNAVSLADFKGKTVILNFWASWCPPCKAEFPDFQKFYNENKDNDEIAMVLINLIGSNGETKADAEAFIQDNGYTLPYYFDVDGQSATAYQIVSIPTTYIISPNGELYYRNVGMMSYDKLVEMTEKAGS